MLCDAGSIHTMAVTWQWQINYSVTQARRWKAQKWQTAGCPFPPLPSPGAVISKKGKKGKEKRKDIITSKENIYPALEQTESRHNIVLTIRYHLKLLFLPEKVSFQKCMEGKKMKTLLILAVLQILKRGQKRLWVEQME